MLNLKDIRMDDITHASFGRRIWYHEESDSDDEDDSHHKSSDRDIQSDPCVKEKFSFYSTFYGSSIRTHYDGEKIKSGLRVMRPRSWKPPMDYTYKSDEREIGTILEVTKEGIVKVQWDSSDDIQYFEKGPTGQYDLLLFDNAQTGVMHTNVQCYGCREYPLRGFRWKCLNCVDYDLCTKCYMNDMHISSHRFKRVQIENAKGVQMSSRQNVEDFTMAHGIGEDAIVQLRSDVRFEGTVEQLLDKKIDAFRSDAKVIKNGSEIRYPVGRDGKCDLKYTKAGEGQLYYYDHLPIVSSDTASTGIRVVRGPEWEENNKDDGGHGYVGTIVMIEKNASEQDQATQIGSKAKANVVHVQWDNGNIRSYNLQRRLLRIYDNGQLGSEVKHETYYCDICYPPGTWLECIKGIRWQCTECQDYNLCNKCYMNDEDNIRHRFQRVIAPDKRDSAEVSTYCRENAVKTQSFGIFKGAEVAELFGRNTVGTVAEICDCNMDNGRSEVAVKWDKWRGSQYGKRSRHDFLELKYKRGLGCAVYHDHLPILGKDVRGYFDVDFVYCENRLTNKKIKVTIWRNIKQERKVTFKPSLFIIFADHPEIEEKSERLVDEVIEFAKKTKLPCHVAGKKIMFYGGSSNSVFIHHKTDKNVIQELVKRGFRQFERGDVKPKEDEIHYFKQMAELVHGEIVLPVIISLRNGGLRKVMMKSATDLKIPIIRLKKHTFDVTVLIPVKYKNYRTRVKMTEHTSDVKKPWSVLKSRSKVFELGRYNDEDDLWEIELISEGPAECRENLDALICYLIIGVSMENNSSKKKIYKEYTDMYRNALSMYLLKEGKWKIPKEHIKKSFDQRSIEYIYEQDMAAEFEKGLWSDLQNDTNMAYTPPRLKDHDEHSGFSLFFGSDSEDDSDDSDDDDDDDEEDDNEANSDDNDDEPDADHDEFNTPTVSHMDKADQQQNEKEIRLKVSISELYGLIFFALLQKQYWNGAKQLIETGCIRIHHILVGCVILENVARNWRTAPILQDRLRRLNKAFTQRAIRILSCIYEADTKSESDIAKQKRYKASVIESDKANEEEMELGEHINHAGRLLLNHGYIEDAIKTQNKTFLDNHYVKNIINKMWYGTEKIKSLTIVGFIVLAVFHIILLPLLMINMEARPLRWLYKQYTLPFMKVCINQLGFLTLLLAYAYMLLFDYSEDGLSKTDLFIITWMASFFLDENKQHIVSIIRKKWKSYVNDWWNRLDWFSIIVYTIGMVLKFGERSQFRDASKVLLVVAFMLLCIRILNLFCMSESLGPKLVMIRKMFADTFAFMTIMTVIMMCYNISFHALLYSNTEFSWLEMEKITQNGYWMLFGELNLDDEKLTIPDCTFNRTYNDSSASMQCPNQIGLYIVPYLKAFYGLIAVILLLNLLIAMYSDTFQQVHQESEFHWLQLQNDFLQEYSIKTVFPTHLQLLVLPFTIVHGFFWFCCTYLCGKLKGKCLRYDNVKFYLNYEYGYDEDGSTLNRSPMFVRVFLYNTNFDLNLKSTKEVEENGALKAKGEIDLMETDRLTKLQTQLESNYNKLEQLSEKNDKRNQKLLNRQKEIEKNQTYLQKLIMKRLKDMNHSLKRIEKSSSETVKFMKDGEETSDEDDIDHIVYSSSSDDDDSDRLSISSDFEETNDPECKMQ